MKSLGTTASPRQQIDSTGWCEAEGVRFLQLKNGPYTIVTRGYNSLIGKDVFGLFLGGTLVTESTSIATLKRNAVKHSRG